MTTMRSTQIRMNKCTAPSELLTMFFFACPKKNEKRTPRWPSWKWTCRTGHPYMAIHLRDRAHRGLAAARNEIKKCVSRGKCGGPCGGGNENPGSKCKKISLLDFSAFQQDCQGVWKHCIFLEFLSPISLFKQRNRVAEGALKQIIYIWNNHDVYSTNTNE